MRATPSARGRTNVWKPIPDPEGRFSSGIAEFDRLLGGGFRRGTNALFTIDETVGREDLDLLLAPALLNNLYHSRGIIAILPSRDSPHDFRARLTQYVTRRRFDSRVRIVDYVGEDEGLSYVVTIRSGLPEAKPRRTAERERTKAMAKMVEAERVVQGGRKKPFVEVTAFEVFETLMGADKALPLFYYGMKRSRQIGNLGIGLLGPGLACAAGVRRMADTEFELHRNEVGLIVRGIRPTFSSCVVTPDLHSSPPHVTFVPPPA